MGYVQGESLHELAYCNYRGHEPLRVFNVKFLVDTLRVKIFMNDNRFMKFVKIFPSKNPLNDICIIAS